MQMRPAGVVAGPLPAAARWTPRALSSRIHADRDRRRARRVARRSPAPH
ncbi:MAG: hypothetical protein IPL36_10295 [Nigerium sp.]|nr:hypothetical protein [Nigerium sp.]